MSANDSFLHCKERMLERYGLHLDKKEWLEYNLLAKKIVEEKKLKSDSNNLVVIQINDLRNRINYPITMSYNTKLDYVTTIQMWDGDYSRKITQIGNWYLPSEFKALDEAKNLAKLPNVREIILSPDLTFAEPIPVGTTVETCELIYPDWIGTDIGCGVTFLELNPKEELDAETLFKKLNNDIWSSINLKNKKSMEYDSLIPSDCELGSIGGGNHFAEIMQCVEVRNEFDNKFSPGKYYLCVHSGSRQFGESIHHEFKGKKLSHGTQDFDKYLKLHDYAVEFARENRRCIAEKVSIIYPELQLDYERNKLIDVVHNHLEIKNNGNNSINCIHRKGTLSVDHEMAIIPGSRGTSTYVVDARNSKLKALPHGAGRQWSRQQAKEYLNDIDINLLIKSPIGSYVVSRNESLLKSEAPECYKDIDMIVDVLIENDVRVLAKFVPILTIKM